MKKKFENKTRTKNDVPFVTLNDGQNMPQLGFGVYKIPDYDQAMKTVELALSNGYRLLDTAEAYHNQKAVGDGIKNSAVKREDVYLTTKLWISNFSYRRAKRAIDHDLEELGTDYIDLMLLHQSVGDVYGAWHALEEARQAGKIRSIGVSNFFPDQLESLALGNKVKPVIDQIEINPWFQRNKLVKFLQKEKVAAEAWAPFAEGKNNLFANQTLKQIGGKYHKSTGQVVLRWLIQRGIIVIPKSTHDERQKENITIFDFTLTDEDMKQISQLDKHRSQFVDHRDPEAIKRVFSSDLAKLK